MAFPLEQEVSRHLFLGLVKPHVSHPGENGGVQAVEHKLSANGFYLSTEHLSSAYQSQVPFATSKEEMKQSLL